MEKNGKDLRKRMWYFCITCIRKTKLETKKFDEKSLIANELISLVKTDFGVDVQVFSENDSKIYDPKGKARQARPFKPAILIE